MGDREVYFQVGEYDVFVDWSAHRYWWMKHHGNFSVSYLFAKRITLVILW